VIPAPSSWLAPFAGGVMGLALSGLAARTLGPRGWMDLPDERHRHGRPTPRTAGLALFTGFLLFRALGISSFHLDPTQWVALVAMVLLGAWDDRCTLSAPRKAALGLAVALLLTVHQLGRLQALGPTVNLAGLAIPTTPWVAGPLLLAWFWGIPQALNLADGLDGFALGLAGLILTATGHGPWAHPVMWGFLISAFLLNYPRAFHFLGDAGSLGLGTLVAMVTMDATVAVDASLALWICAYLVVDCTTVVVSRWLRHRPLGLGDRSHLHHLVVDACGGRAWLATPLLLGAAWLPMRTVGAPVHGNDVVGLLALLGLGLLALRRSLNLKAQGPVPVPMEPAPLRPWDAERTSA
jgi:UDP-GlcNAc:undecaprenyl-phosphate GlcNAc-1-phosphate transferase